MTEDLRLKIERFKILCEDLDNEDKDIFIKFYQGGLERWSSAKIILIGETNIFIQPFKGHNINERIQVRWANIIDIEEYLEEVK